MPVCQFQHQRSSTGIISDRLIEYRDIWKIKEIRMRIVLDAMGSDTCPEPEVKAAVEAAQQFGDEILLVGPEESLRQRLQPLNGATANVRLVDAPETITMEDKGLALALKAKRPRRRTRWQSASTWSRTGKPRLS